MREAVNSSGALSLGSRVLACLGCLAVAGSALAGLQIERVFGPETRTGAYKHPSSLTELDNGDLLLAYYGGGGEYESATAVFGSRRKRNSKRWSSPVVLARNPMYSMGNPVIWQAPDGRVWLFFVVRPGPTWSTSRIGAKVSDDRGRSWSDTFMVTFDEGTMVRSRPIVLSDGHYLLPIYHETGADTEMTAPDTGSVFLRYDPRARSWSRSPKVLSRLGNLQAGVVELDPMHLLALCRRGGDYEPGDDGYAVRTESFDGGRTWTPGVETEFPNPNSAVELIRLRSGSLLFIYNHSMSERTPLRAVLSTDGGRTWPRQVDLASGPGSFSYPTAIQARDGWIHVTFTSDERTVIRRASFREDDIP
jgi:predicted neuraminidase